MVMWAKETPPAAGGGEVPGADEERAWDADASREAWAAAAGGRPNGQNGTCTIYIYIYMYILPSEFETRV